jgi:Ca-activated chloride channel homolog
LKNTITQLGIEYRLMTQFTSFVAVEEMIVTDGGQPRRIDVPVEVPEGIERRAVEVENRQYANFALATSTQAGGLLNRRIAPAEPSRAKASGGGGSGRAYPTPPNQSPVESLSVIDALSPEEQKLNRIRTKVHPSIFALIQRLNRKEILPGADEAKFVSADKAVVQVWLSDKSDIARAKLKELGFEVLLDATASKLIVGRLPIDKLEALAALDFVKYVAPQVSK